MFSFLRFLLLAVIAVVHVGGLEGYVLTQPVVTHVVSRVAHGSIFPFFDRSFSRACRAAMATIAMP